MLASASVANAATFNFSFSNVEGAVGGTVEGIIELPDGDGTFAATSVTVTSAPAILGYPLPVDFVDGGEIANSFTIISGMIDATVSTFVNPFPVSFPFGTALALNDGFEGSLLNVPGSGVTSSGVQDLDSSTLNYSNASATTPESTSMITLIGLGLLGVGSKLKKKS